MHEVPADGNPTLLRNPIMRSEVIRLPVSEDHPLAGTQPDGPVSVIATSIMTGPTTWRQLGRGSHLILLLTSSAGARCSRLGCLVKFLHAKKKPPKPGRTLTFLSCVLVADSVSKMSFGHVDSEMSLLRPLPASDSKVFSSGLKIALDSITNRFPFSCAETRKQLLLAAVEIPPKKEISECTASLAAVDAAVAVV